MVHYIRDFIKIIKDNLSVIVRGDFEEGATDLNTLGNLAILRVSRKVEHPSVKNLPKLSREQKRQLRAFYSPYVRHMTDRYHRLYTCYSGQFYPEYLPEEFYAMWIDRYYSDRQEGRYLDNKCYYYRLFSNVKQPELVAMRIGGTWLDGNLEPVPSASAEEAVSGEPEVVLKKAVNSEGGYGVAFLSGEDMAGQFRAAMADISCDVVIQRPVRQHEALAALHPESVNTMRIVSLMTGHEIKIYAAVLKIGVGASRSDNACQGGLYCGISPDGSLRERAILDSGEALWEHPDLGYRFSGHKVPCLEKAFELVRKAHAFMGHFRLISWDVAIDEGGDAVLIEANLSLGGISDVQMCCGPLFGEDTDKVVREAMQGRRNLTTWI